MCHRENSGKDIYPWDPLLRSYHGVFLIFAVVTGAVIAILFFSRVGIPDFPETSPESEFITCPVRHYPFDYEQKIENRLREHEVKLESMSNGLTLWATVMTACHAFMAALNVMEREKAKRPSVSEYFEWRWRLVNKWIAWIKAQSSTVC